MTNPNPQPLEVEKQQEHGTCDGSKHPHPYSERACQGWHWRPQGEDSNPQPPTGEAARVSERECGYCGGTGEIACSSTHYEKCPHCNGIGIACECALHTAPTPEAGGDAEVRGKPFICAAHEDITGNVACPFCSLGMLALRLDIAETQLASTVDPSALRGLVERWRLKWVINDQRANLRECADALEALLPKTEE